LWLTSTELLRAIAEVLDIRSVFRRVSGIVNQVLPHDALAVKFSDRAGNVALEARSAEDLPARVGYQSRRQGFLHRERPPKGAISIRGVLAGYR